MKFVTRLILNYVVVTLVLMLIGGFVVLKSIQVSVMNSVEQQLIEQSRVAQGYIDQVPVENFKEELNAEDVRRIVGNLDMKFNQVGIFDKNSKLMGSSQKWEEEIVLLDKKSHSRILQEAQNGKYAYVIVKDKAFFAAPLEIGGQNKGVIEIVYPINFLNKILENVTATIILGAVIFIFLAIVISVYMVKRMFRPMNKLVEVAQNYAKHDFTPVSIQSDDEIGQLSKSFNDMGVELKDYIRRQKQFVSNVSHEIRTPLTAIKGYSEYLIDEVAGNEQLEKVVYYLNSETEKLAKMLNEMLLLSRIDAGRENIKFDNVNLTILLEDVTAKMIMRAEKYGVKLVKTLDKNIHISGETEKLMQVFINLIDNAIKFSPVESSIYIVLENDNKNAVVKIRDSGIGIPVEEVEKIFDRFYRASNAESIPGTGLGLAITKEIVEKHKGRITFRNCLEGGTEVKLVFPDFKAVEGI